VCPDDGVHLTPTGLTSAATTGALALQRAVDDELAPGTLAGEYRIERKIGHGGMGTVYGAVHPLIGKRAAIKVIRREMSSSPEAVERFVREAQAVNQVGHPNIVDVFGFGKLPDGRSFFVMEWLQGETLRARMRRSLSLAEALDILEQIATALEAAHDAGVLHRDLKPDNVFMQQQRGGAPKVKLLDFGLAKLQGNDSGGIEHTRTGVVMGTPLYLSPEQAKGVKVDLAADIYSLGAIAYEMCSGQVPFTADSAVEIMAKHISARVVPLFQVAPHTPPPLDALVLAMLDKDPRKRPPIARVCEQLRAVRGSLGAFDGQVTIPSAAAVGTPPAQTSTAKTRKRALAIGLAAAVLVGGGVAAFVLIAGGGDDTPHVHAPEVAAEPPKPEPPKPAPPEPVKLEPAATEGLPKLPDQATVMPAKPEPTPHAVPVKQVGTIEIKLEGVQQAKISVDRKPVEPGVAIELAPGRHSVHAESAGHLPADETIHVTAGKKQVVKLRLKSKPSGNSVYDPFAD
jgi:serine/threonine-protein kinase